MTEFTFKYITGTPIDQPFDLDPHTNPTLKHMVSMDPLEWRNQDNFVSGSNNKQGLHLKPRIQDQKIVAAYTFQKHLSGPPMAAHGGIHSAIQDELMGMACGCLGFVTMTLKLEVNYRHPVFFLNIFLQYNLMKKL